MSYEIPFLPQATTVLLDMTVANTSVNVELPAWPQPLTGGVRVMVEAAGRVHLAWGLDNTVAATTANMPLRGDAVESFALPLNTRWVAAICPGGVGRVWLTPGRGL